MRDGSACQEFVCFHKFTGLPVLHNWQLRGCIILIKVLLVTLAFLTFSISSKTRKSEMVVKYDGEVEDAVTFPQNTHKVVLLYCQISRFLATLKHHFDHPSCYHKCVTMAGGDTKDPPGV